MYRTSQRCKINFWTLSSMSPKLESVNIQTIIIKIQVQSLLLKKIHKQKRMKCSDDFLHMIINRIY